VSGVGFPLRLSLQVALVATVFTVLIGTPLAYVLARKQFRGKEILDLVLTLPMVLPPVVVGYYLLLLIGNKSFLGRAFHAVTGHDLGILFTWQAAVIAAFVVSFPLMIKTSRAAMESVDQELVNASYTLGRSERETAVRVVVPLARKGMIAGGTLAFARALGEFGATIMVAGNIAGRTQTMPIKIYDEALYGGQSGGALILVVFLTVVSGAFIYVANRFSRGAVA
jgi:molybdate transport system permease protein